MTSWTITVDHIADPKAKAPSNANAVGMVGPRASTMTAEQIRNHPDKVAFRMYDDDGGRYYDGFLVGQDLLAPLVDFGTPNAGATGINIRTKTGKWEAV
jgi:hypothetical protein